MSLDIIKFQEPSTNHWTCKERKSVCNLFLWFRLNEQQFALENWLLNYFPQSVEGEHHEKAVELLKAAKDSVKLVVRYTPKVLEEMEARFEKLRTARRRQQQQLLMQQQQQQNLAAQQNHMS